MGLGQGWIARDPKRAGTLVPSGIRAFTLIELMVVVAIIVMAAGLMAPTITDFFKNRQLDGIRGHFGAAFNQARLAAVNQGKPVSLVFFREGVRIYDEARRTFDPKYSFNADTAPFSSDKVWYVLGFDRKKPSLALPEYKQWEKNQKASQEAVKEAVGRDTAAARASGRRGSHTGQMFNVNGLPKLTFQRDGSVVFGTGSDVSTSEFSAKQVPDNADIIIYQVGNTTACFMDIRPMGQIRSKTEPMEAAMPKPTVEGVESSAGDPFELEYETPKPKSDSEGEED